MEKNNKPDKNIFDKILSYIEDKFLWVSIMILLFMTFFITLDAALRYIFGIPLPGGYEVSEEFLLPCMTFMAMSAVFVMGGHVRVTMLVDHLPRFFMNPINFIQDILMLVFSAIVTYGAWLTTLKAITKGEFSNSILAYPMAPAYGTVVLGMGLLFLRQVYYFVKQSEREKQLELAHEEMA